VKKRSFQIMAAQSCVYHEREAVTAWTSAAVHKVGSRIDLESWDSAKRKWHGAPDCCCRNVILVNKCLFVCSSPSNSRRK